MDISLYDIMVVLLERGIYLVLFRRQNLPAKPPESQTTIEIKKLK
jgi:hypothetical protein